VPEILLVTGASRGIGAAVARKAAPRGWSIVVNYLSDRDGADAVVRDIETAGARALAVRADVASEAEVVAMFDAIDGTLGPVSRLVNNAGIIGRDAPMAEIRLEDLQAVFATNVFGQFMVAREAIRRMLPAHGGHGGAIVNVSSMAAINGGRADRFAYSSSKGAIDALTIALALENASHGIRVNGVRPGIVATALHDGARQAEAFRRASTLVPMRRMAEPEEVADAVLWLLSDEASFVTGTIVNVAGGRQ
jgi:NAD(P)-dependent dehydrogenase (short-subunit alcohol dehydrogenase family)